LLDNVDDERDLAVTSHLLNACIKGNTKGEGFGVAIAIDENDGRDVLGRRQDEASEATASTSSFQKKESIWFRDF
jgi:hypothetical protein